MTQEDKNLLLKDLCTRLPYGVKVDYESYIYILNEIDTACKDIDYITVRIQDVKRLRCAESVLIENIKPYLRPMSSMTEEEKKEYFGRTMTIGIARTSKEIIDWLNKYHFDYRGLIEKGLAIEVTENNPYKDKL